MGTDFVQCEAGSALERNHFSKIGQTLMGTPVRCRLPLVGTTAERFPPSDTGRSALPQDLRR